MNRREFVGGVTAMGMAATAATSPWKALAASDRVRFGLIGAGSRGQQDLKDAIKLPNVECVAVADIYSRRRDEAKAIATNATMYEDPRSFTVPFRTMRGAGIASRKKKFCFGTMLLSIRLSTETAHPMK